MKFYINYYKENQGITQADSEKYTLPKAILNGFLQVTGHEVNSNKYPSEKTFLMGISIIYFYCVNYAL